MGKRKSERLKLKSGSRLKLQNGRFARVLKTPKIHETTVLVQEFYKKKWEQDAIHYIPMGQISEVVRY